jgi:hypothetical protein
MIGVSLGLFLISYQFYAISTNNTPTTIQVVSQASPLTLVVNLEKGQETSVLAKDMLSRGVLLNAKIKDPEGSVVFSETFDDKILSSFTPRISGTYTYVVISLSSDGTTIKGSIGNPFVVERIANAETAGDILGPEFSLWAYAGLGVFVGVIIVIAGAIKFVMSKIRLRKYFTNKNSTEEIPVKEWDEPK